MSKYNNNNHNMAIFNKKLKNCKEIQLTKIKTDLNNRIMEKHPASPVPPVQPLLVFRPISPSICSTRTAHPYVPPDQPIHMFRPISPSICSARSAHPYVPPYQPIRMFHPISISICSTRSARAAARLGHTDYSD